MSLSPNFIQEYYDLLKKCISTVDQSNRYEAVCKEYKALHAKINGILKARDSLCTDAVACIDKSTGNVKPNAEWILEGDEALLAMVKELGELYIKKQYFAETFKWTDSLMPNLDIILANAKVEELEKEIIAHFGKEEGRTFICTVKKEMAAFEKEIGVRFYADDAERMETLLRIRVLFSPKNEIEITAEDNVDEQPLNLSNEKGESLRFQKNSLLHHRNAIYTELEFLEEARGKKLHYYKLEQTKDGQKLIMEEDEAVDKELWKKQERLY